jgi:hypothetical protein
MKDKMNEWTVWLGNLFEINAEERKIRTKKSRHLVRYVINLFACGEISQREFRR